MRFAFIIIEFDQTKRALILWMQQANHCGCIEHWNTLTLEFKARL